MEHGKQRTLEPEITGASIVGIIFDGGVAIAADTLGSFGRMAHLRNIPRISKVNESCVIGASGDYADFQFLDEIIQQRVNRDICLADGYTYKPRALHSWCTRVLYNRRSEFNPLWNRIIVAGMEDTTTPFLGSIDLLGNAYESPCISSGFGNYIALPILREFLERHNGLIDENQARDILDRCLKVLYYRDGRAYDKYSLAIVSKDGARIEENKQIKSDWSIASQIRGYQ